MAVRTVKVSSMTGTLPCAGAMKKSLSNAKNHDAMTGRKRDPGEVGISRFNRCPNPAVDTALPPSAQARGYSMSPRVSPPDRIEKHPQTGTPAANRTAQIRTATAIVPTNPSHSLYGAVSGIPPSNVSRIATPPFDLACPQCGNKVVKNMDRLTLPLKKRGV